MMKIIGVAAVIGLFAVVSSAGAITITVRCNISGLSESGLSSGLTEGQLVTAELSITPGALTFSTPDTNLLFRNRHHDR
jgi:hypothetical protein